MFLVTGFGKRHETINVNVSRTAPRNNACSFLM